MILIDPPAWPARGRLWSHLASDTSLEELHDFAARAGVPRGAFEGDHYDVPAESHADLTAAGAVDVSTRRLLAALVAAGLRRRRRRGEEVLSSRLVDDYLPGAGPCRVEALLSGLPTPHDADGWWLHARDGLVAAEHAEPGWRLPVLAASAASAVLPVPPTPPTPSALQETTPWSAARVATRHGQDDAAGEAVGHVRVRLLGEPAPAYRGPRPWVFRPLRRPPRRGTSTTLVPPEQLCEPAEVLALVHRVLRREQAR